MTSRDTVSRCRRHRLGEPTTKTRVGSRVHHPGSASHFVERFDTSLLAGQPGDDERVGALQDLLDTQLCPTARQFLGSLPTIVRYDDSLNEHVQLESLVSLPGGVSHELHSVVDARHFPRRKIWLRSPATKGDTGEADDVSFRCGEGEELRTVATDENGRMRLLDGQRMDFVLRHSIVLTGERDLLAREQPLDDDAASANRSTLAPPGSKRKPACSYSAFTYPAPRPSSSRPSVRRSMVAASRATNTGWRKSLFSTVVPTRIVFVAAAALTNAGIGANISAR